MDNKVTYVVSLKDDLSKGISHIDTKAKGLNATMSGIGTAIAGMGIAFAGISFFKNAVNAFTESEQALAQLQSTMKSTGNASGISIEAMKAQSVALMNLTTYDDDAIISMQSLLGTFTQVKGAIFTDAVPAILDMSTKLGTDLKSSAIQVGKALNDPIKGVGALSKVGVSFTAGQKEMIKTLVETNRVGEAQAMILKELQVEFGGSAEASANTASGGFMQLQNQMGNVTERIGELILQMGQKLLPTLEKFVVFLADAVEVGVKYSGTLKSIVVSVGLFYTGMKVATLATTAFGASATLALGPIGLIATGIMAIVTACNFLSDAYDEVREKELRQARSLRDTQVGIYKDRYAKLQKESGLPMSEFVKQENEKIAKSLKENDDLNRTALLHGGKVNNIGLVSYMAEKRDALKMLGGDGGNEKSGLTPSPDANSKPKSAKGVDTKTKAVGSKSVTINVSIKDLIGTYNMNVTNIKEGANKARELILQALTTSINDFQDIKPI